MIAVADWDGKQTDVVIHGSFEAVAARMAVRAQVVVTSPPYRTGGGLLLSVPAMTRSKARGGPTLRDNRLYKEVEGDAEVEDETYRTWVRLCTNMARVTFWNVGYKFRAFDWGQEPFGHAVWFKPNAIPFNRAGVIYNHEFIFLFGDHRALKKPVKSVWEMLPQYNSKHPAPFPPDLPYRAILAATDAGDLVFDPFGGSFTTAATAKAMNRHWLSCDVSEEYCAWGEQRILRTEGA